jgi:hypothetical protein
MIIHRKIKASKTDKVVQTIMRISRGINHGSIVVAMELFSNGIVEYSRRKKCFVSYFKKGTSKQKNMI